MKEELKKLIQEYLKETIPDGCNYGDYWKVLSWQNFIKWVLK